MRSGFFENTAVMAEDFARFARGLLTNGVLADTDTALKVSPGSGMRVSVAPGYCWINGHFGVVETAETLVIAPSDGTLGRKDRVVARLDIDLHEIRLAVITGEASETPAAPNVVRSGNYYDLGLAIVNVPAGTLEITQMLLTDTREDTEVCGGVLYRNADIMVLDTKADKSDIVNPVLLPYRDLGEVFADEIAEYGGDAYAWIKSRVLANKIDDIYLGDTMPPFEVEWEGVTYSYTPRVFRMEKQWNNTIPYIDFFCDELWFMPLMYNLTYWNGGFSNYYVYDDYSTTKIGETGTITSPYLCSYVYHALNNAEGYYAGFCGYGSSYYTTNCKPGPYVYHTVSSGDPEHNVIGLFPQNVRDVISDKIKYSRERYAKGYQAAGSINIINFKNNVLYVSDVPASYVPTNVGKLWLPSLYELFGSKLPTYLSEYQNANMIPGVTSIAPNLLRKKRYIIDNPVDYTYTLHSEYMTDDQYNVNSDDFDMKNYLIDNTFDGIESGQTATKFDIITSAVGMSEGSNVNAQKTVRRLVPICFTIQGD